MKNSRSGREAFGHSEYLLPENFRSLHRKDIPVTYRLHDDLLRYYRKGTRPVTHPSKIINVSMSVFLYQIIKLDAVKNTISLSGSFEMYWQDEFLQWEPDTYEGATEIFLAIVQDMPKFSMSERKGRGSFSGIPLIGLYYFMLLVIVSFSTVTTSMFVYMERNVRIHNRIPFYLRWLITFEKKKKQLSFRGISTKRRRAHAFENEATQIHSTITPPTHGHLNGFVGSGIVSSQQQLLTDDRQSLLNVHHRLSGSISNSNATTQNVALSLLRLISCDRDSGSRQDKALSKRKKVTVEAPEENCQPDKKFKKRKDEQLNSSEGIKLRKSNSPIPPPPPSPAAAALSQRKRHSLLHAESPLVG
uniref:Neurotransmitter-gated ion-channel ligand-binding domain-containing protein n=1 Tax=Meloidogyne javanica TaxID=6303 RepID=A0A915LH33_MELJA